MQEYKGLRVWITGASGGIGWSCAELFARGGAELLLHANRRLEDLEQRVARQEWSERAQCFSADLRDYEGLERALAAALQEQARPTRLDVVVVNAGIWPSAEERLDEQDPKRIREVLEVNLLGALWTAKAFTRRLAALGPRADERGASVCLIGSTAGRFGEAGHLEYSVSKAGLVGLMNSLKNEVVHLDPYARVNLVEPGWTATPMAAPALETPGQIAGACQTMALRQIARPQDVAESVAFLCSPERARHLSGQYLTVAGGMEGRRLWAPESVDEPRVRARLQEG